MISFVTLGISCAILATIGFWHGGFWHGTRMYQLGLKSGRLRETPASQIPSEHDRMRLNRAIHLTQIAAQIGIADREIVTSLVLADAIDDLVSRAMAQIREDLHQAVQQLLAGKRAP
jgi:hypothetical protein